MSLTTEVWILKQCLLVELNHGPDRDSFLTDLHFHSFELTIIEEVAISTSLQLYRQERQQAIIEFKLVGHLMPQLVHTIQELKVDL